MMGNFVNVNKIKKEKPMTDNLKPTSKVIQISTSGVANTNATQCDMITTILCEDGSVWQSQLNFPIKWYCILEAIDNAK